jgi:hypothetical protein
VENSVSSANIAGSVYAQGVESDITCPVNLAESEAVSVIPTAFRAGLTPKQVTRFLSKIQRTDGCWPWMAARFQKGYGMFNAGRFRDGRTDIRYAHRVVWEFVNGPIPAGAVVRHSCDNPPCCNPAHLLIGTQADNVNDAKVQGKYRDAAHRRWSNPERHQLILALVHAPRGSVMRASREHGIPFRALAQAVGRVRRNQSQTAELTHG